MGTLSFRDDPDAYCFWAKSHTNRLEGLELLAQPLRDDSWKDDAARWVFHLSWPPFWEQQVRHAAIEARSNLIRTIVGGTLDDAAYAALPGIFNTQTLAPIVEAGEIASWLAVKAGPNDAPVVADIVQHVVYDRRGALRQDCFPLVEWLLTHGSSELRSGRRSQLVAQIVPLVVEHGDTELLAPAIRYVLYNEHKLQTDAHGVNTIEKLVPAVERVIVDTGSSALVGDLVEALDPSALEVYLDRVLLWWQQVPRSREEVISRLAKGEIDVGRAPAMWRQIVAGPPADISFGNASIAGAAVAGLVSHVLGSHHEPSEFAAPLDRRRWGYIVGRGFLRATDLLVTRQAQDIGTLQNGAGFDREVLAGVHAAVKEAVDSSTDLRLDDVRTMLASPGTDESVVVGALELLKRKPVAAPTPRRSGNLDHLVEAIKQALGSESPVVSGFDFRKLVNDATKAKAGHIEGERAFVIKSDTLVVSKEPLLGLLGVSDDADVQRALGVMYAIHEVVHDYQGIAEKGDVSRVRFAGAESALMHVDLGADHVAAVVANSIFPEWDLLWLKDWAGRSIPAFPAGPRHPRYSRIRKVLRFVGLRVDLALRRHDIGAEHIGPESYGFADFSPAGGSFIAMVNRPPFVVVKVGTASARDVGVLFGGIEGGDGVVEQVDEIIERVLAS